MNISINIVKLEPRRMGEEVQLTVRIASGENEDTVKLTVSSKMLFEVGNIGVGSIPYELTREQFDSLEYSAKMWEAVKKGIDLIAYGDNTRSQLVMKLRARGFNKYTAEDAAQYVEELGYIDEKGILERSVHQLANVKLYGKSRIKNELYKKGISREVISEYLDGFLDEIDFSENLRKLIQKKCDFERIYDCKYRESLYAAMYRLGYSPSETRSAIKSAAEEE